MAKAANISGTQQLEIAKLGYQTANNFVSLVSQEIYSRFNSMLTANSILVAVIGWTFASKVDLPKFLAILLPTLGLVLCLAWFLFVGHGVYWQSVFREHAAKIEAKYFSGVFEILPASDAFVPSSIVRSVSFKGITSLVILVFAAFYAALIVYQILYFV